MALRLRHRDSSPAGLRRLTAVRLAPGDRLQVERGRRYERVVSVTRNAGSQTVDVEFESGRRGTFRYGADLAVALH